MLRNLFGDEIPALSYPATKLIVNKALWSISLDVSAAATSPTIKAKMVGVAKQILTALGLG